MIWMWLSNTLINVVKQFSMEIKVFENGRWFRIVGSITRVGKEEKNRVTFKIIEVLLCVKTPITFQPNFYTVSKYSSATIVCMIFEYYLPDELKFDWDVRCNHRSNRNKWRDWLQNWVMKTSTTQFVECVCQAKSIKMTLFLAVYVISILVLFLERYIILHVEVWYEVPIVLNHLQYHTILTDVHEKGCHHGRDKMIAFVRDKRNIPKWVIEKF